jgi:hypothetical protein
MANCLYLKYKKKSCVNCSGFTCTVGGDARKLSDTTICRNDQYLDCTIYQSTLPDADRLILSTPPLRTAPTRTDEPVPLWTEGIDYNQCPYQGDVTEACCHAICYAKNQAKVAPRKNCRSFTQCTRFLSAKNAGTPYR